MERILKNAVYTASHVLHAFHTKSQKTTQRELDLVAAREWRRTESQCRSSSAPPAGSNCFGNESGRWDAESGSVLPPFWQNELEFMNENNDRKQRLPETPRRSRLALAAKGWLVRSLGIDVSNRG